MSLSCGTGMCWVDLAGCAVKRRARAVVRSMGRRFLDAGGWCRDGFRMLCGRGVVGVVFSDWVVGDVSKLILIVACVNEAVRMVSVWPEVALEVVADGEGKAALDELDATLDGLIRGGCQQGVEMVRHDDEGMECEAGLIAVPKQRVDHELRGCSALEDAVALICDDSDGEGFRINSYSWAAIRRHISGAKAQICGEGERPG